MKSKIFLIQIICVMLLIDAAIAQEKNPLSVYKSEMKNEKFKINTIERSISNDTIFYPFGRESVLTSLSVSGNLKLFSKKSFLRITLIDSNGIEYLVFESNYLTNDTLYFLFQDEFEETGVLENITPVFLSIHISEAKLDKLKVNYTENLEDKDNRIKNMKQEIIEYKEEQKIAQINKRIAELNQKWIAGKTSISKLSYNEKKRYLEIPYQI